MKRFLSKLDFYSGVGIHIALILFICCLVFEELLGIKIAWMSRVAMVLIVISIILIAICYVITVAKLIKDYYTSRKNKGRN